MNSLNIEWITIPSGEALISNTSKNEIFGTDHKKCVYTKVYLSEFQISKYPVTNAQYKEFLIATNHNRPSSPFFAQFDLGKMEYANHPVSWISWFDATAFCQWIGGRLPTGVEWEKSASGDAGLVFPWGNTWRENHCNSLEAGKKMTTPVDQYPQGVSPYGVYDMAGNVWEWTDEWVLSKKKMTKLGFRETMKLEELNQTTQLPILRGGSLISDKLSAQTCFRYVKYLPNEYGDWVGFRPVKHLMTA
jgi:formylglycine-generating enzyme required for sulfatase activity